MNYRAYIYTLALLGALALAAVSGGLFTSSDNTVYAAEPEFVSGAGTREVPENTPPGVNIEDPISATDADEDTEEYGNTLTYSLEAIDNTPVARADAASFDIDASTGQLITKAPLDTEAKASYRVRVRVDDGETRAAASPCTTCTRDVEITVTNVNEPPAAPTPPTVVSGVDLDDGDPDESTTSLKVVWHPPENTGPRTITGYEVEFKKSTETTFGDTGVTIAATTATITGLDADTSYDVRVRATNGEADSTENWSLVGTGSTNKEGNKAPSFNEDDSFIELDVDENTPAGENIDSPVTATDKDTTTLTYQFDGPHKDMFSFDTRSAQIRTKSPLNHEDARCGYVEPADPATPTTCTYRVTVIVDDGAGGSDAMGVNIEVDDRTEIPSAPARPTVRATEKSSTSLDVSWTAPANTGPAITSYIVEYRKGNEAFSTDGVTITGTTAATISGNNAESPPAPWLAPNTTYEVRVRAINAERLTGGPWSATGTGRTNRANHEPIFDDRPGSGDDSVRGSDYTIWRTIDENPRSGQSIGRIFADDTDNDRLTYKLVESADTDDAREELSKFTINETTGEIRTKAGETYSYEDLAETGTCGTLTEQQVGTDRCYTVKVEVRDGLDNNRVEVKDEADDDTITLKIGLRDRAEAPSVPTVMVTAPDDHTKLVVTWHAGNTGPDISGYDVQYRKGGGTFSDDNCRDTTEDGNCAGTTDTDTTITGLDADTSYSVQVRARNVEGTSAWSSVETVKTNKEATPPNTPPTFTDGDTAARSVEESKSSTDVGIAVDASDTVSDVLTYDLGGPDETLFSIVSTTGQIRTRSALDTEALCSDSDADLTDGHQENCNYIVWVKVDDRAGGSALTVVTITISDVDEPPSPPSAPRVTATKDTGQRLDVSWNAPRNTGKPPITDYDIQYREVKTGTSQDDWELWPHGTATDPDADNTATTTEITRRLPAPDAEPLKPRTQYEVRVRAKNGEPEGDAADNWSSVAKATTGQSNSRPSFDNTMDAVVGLRVDENTRAGQNIGNAVSASDADSNSLTYTLEGPGKDSFTIISSSGQIRTRSPLNYEERSSYSVTVKVDDRQRKDNSVAAKSVTIMVDDIREPPSPPAAPMVAGIPGSTSSIRVMWAAPANTGPDVTGYDVQYREVGSGPTRWPHVGADRSTIVTDLKAGTRYEVQVRTRSEEGTSDWSRWGSGMPNPDVANRNPAFSAGSRSLSVPENTPPNTDVGAPVAATDRDGDTLTYTLEAADADSFDILSTSDGGQIRTSAALDHEEKASYAVTVRVTDGRGGTDAVNVTIRVTDVDGEAPDTPFAPTVTAVSSTSLQVTWDAPTNTGPPITDYDYQYREPSGTWTQVINTRITATAETIEGLAASTSYDVEVRATNAEGTSDWSDPGIGATNAPGANNPPVFSEGAIATRSVSANATAGTSIGLPVTATDADSDDTLTYTLEGRDAALFDIGETNGQLLTKSGVTLLVGETYTVIVAADDQTEIARITVTIEATAAPPNNPPVFTEGASATRSVREDAAPGTSIGSPVRATDADQGDTLTYSLEGQDAASFNINSTTGQLLTISGVTLTAGEIYRVTVAASDTKTSATITVTITVTAAPPNRPPVFSEGASATRSVREDTSAGQPIGSPVRATDADQGDTLTYALEGTDAAAFDIVASSGQIRTLAALDADTKATYAVTVRATDSRGGSDTIDVTITVTLTNRAPAFPSTTAIRRVDENTAAGIDIGLPVSATDPNVGDTLTYSLSGADAASFDIDTSTGQLRTRAALDYETKFSYSVTVTVSDTQLTDIVSVTINIMDMHPSCASAIGNGANTGLANDCEALLDSKATLEGTTGSLNWATFFHISQWDGVTVGGTSQRVTRLNLRSMGLVGTVPADLNELTMLTRLWLHNNSLAGEIPDLSGLTNLESLWLSGSSMDLSGDISRLGLGSKTRLDTVSLWGNRLTGSIPDLSRLHSLVRLKLQSNSLSGGVPASLGSLSSLRDLRLRNNQLEGSIPTELNEIDSLQILALENTGLTGSIPDLSGLTRLRTLNLRNNNLTGSIPAWLGDMDNMVILNLHTNQLTGSIPSELGDMDGLLRLYLHRNQLAGNIPSELGDLGDTLTHLWLAGNTGLTGCVPSALSGVPNNDLNDFHLSICQ